MTPAIIPQKRLPSRYVGRLHVVSRSVQSVEAQIVMKLRRARVCGSRPAPSIPASHLLPCPLQPPGALRENILPTPEANGHAAKSRLLLNHNHDINGTGGFMYHAAPKRASSDQTHNRHNMSVKIKPREPPLVQVDARDNDSPSASATRRGEVGRVGRETGVVFRRQDDDTGDTSTDRLGLLSKRPLDSGVHLTKWRRRSVRGEKVLRQLGRTRESMDMDIEEKRLRMARDLVRRLAAEKKHLLAPTAAKTEKERTTAAAATDSLAISARGEEAYEETRDCDKQEKPSRTPVRRVPWRTERSKGKVPLEENERRSAEKLRPCAEKVFEGQENCDGFGSVEMEARALVGNVTRRACSNLAHRPWRLAGVRAKKRTFAARRSYVASTAAAMSTLYPRVLNGNRRHRRASRCSHTPCSDGDPAGPLEKPSSPSMPRRSYPPPWNVGLTARLGVGSQMRATDNGGIRRSHARHAAGNSKFGPHNVRGGEVDVSEPWIRDWECLSCDCDSHPDLGSIAPDDGEWFPACTLSDAGRQQEGDGVDDSEAKGYWLGPGGAFSRLTPLRPPSRRGPRPARLLTPLCGQCRHCGVPMGRRVDQIRRKTAHKSQEGACHRHVRRRVGGTEDKSPRRARKPSVTRRFAGRPLEPRQRRQKRPRWNSRFWVPEQMTAAPRPAVNRCGSSKPPDGTEPAQVADTKRPVRATVHPCDCPSQADDVGPRLAQIKQEHVLQEIGRVYAHEIEYDKEYPDRDNDSLTVVLSEESDLGTSSSGGRRSLEMIVSELSTTMSSREPPRGQERRGRSLGHTHHGQGESPRPEEVLPMIFGDRNDRDDSDVGMQERESNNGGVPASRGLLLEFMWPSTPRSAYCVVCTEAATTAVAPPGREWPPWSAHHPQCIGGRKVGRGNSGALAAEESGKALASRRPALPTATQQLERSQSSDSTTLTRSIDSPLFRSNRCCSANYLVLTLGFLRHMVEIFLAGGGENHHSQKAAGVTATDGDQGLRNRRQASTSHSTLWSDTRVALGRIHAFSTFGAEGRGVNRSDAIQGRLLDAMTPTDLCRGLVPLIVRAFRPPQNVFRRRKRDGSGALCDDGLEFGVFLGWAVRKQLQLPSGRSRRDVDARATAVDIFRRLYKYESGCGGNKGSGAKVKGHLSTSTTGGGKFHRWITPESTVSTIQSDASSDSRQADSNPTDDVSSADASDRSYNSLTPSTTFITQDADSSMSYGVVGGSASAETLSSLGTWGAPTQAGGSVNSSLGSESGVSDVHSEANEMPTLVSGGNGLGRAPRGDSYPYPSGLNLRILAEMQRANPHVRFPGLAEVARMFADELARLAKSIGGAAADG